MSTVPWEYWNRQNTVNCGHTGTNTENSGLTTYYAPIVPLNWLVFTVPVSPPQDRTAAVVGVKAELGSPLPTSPDKGRVEFFIDW